jgi:hypothetical protein
MGIITGEVKDSIGAMVAGATVTMRHNATNAPRTADNQRRCAAQTARGRVRESRETAVTTRGMTRVPVASICNARQGATS